ncbi:MAG: DUF7822 domain-containing protein [Flavobacteriales bacterium]
MANRSYLYALDFDPAENPHKAGGRSRGIAEYNYYLPLPFQILVSADPKICRSVIWDYDDAIAIRGRYKEGRDRLFRFLEELSARNIYPETELRLHISRTRAFLNNEENHLDYMILECAELFEMGDNGPEKQNAELHEEIQNIDDLIADFYTEVDIFNLRLQALQKQLEEQRRPAGLLQKLFGPKELADTTALEQEIAKIEQEKWFILGIGDWSNILYYEPRLRGGKDRPEPH